MTSSTRQLLVAWEAALDLSPARRAIELAAVVSPDIARSSLSGLTVGQRDEALMRLRRAAFGARVAASTSCPHCAERVEVSFDIDHLRSSHPAPPAHSLRSTIEVEVDGWSVTFRLPTSEDLIDLEQCATIDQARSRLIELCAASVSHRGKTASATDLPEAVVAALGEALGEADGCADIQLAVACPECETEWPQTFDINSFLWAELDAWARRLLAEIHVLARAYGWSEEEIVGLSPLRRRVYLEMVAA